MDPIIPPIDPAALYQHLLKAYRHRKVCCSVCGERYSFDSLNMCRNCGSVFCGRCTDKRTERVCDCGGGID